MDVLLIEIRKFSIIMTLLFCSLPAELNILALATETKMMPN